LYSSRAVAAEAKVSAGLVFFYFESVDRLLVELLDWLLANTLIAADIPDRLAEVTDPGARMMLAIRRDVEWLPRQRERVELRQGSLTYRDRELAGFDAATVVEVIEHLDPPRLDAFERVVFAHAKPRVVVVTTPNVEYYARFETLPTGTLRHRDHRFEWTRAEFQGWADAVAARRDYRVAYSDIGPVDPEVGAPTQMAVFTR
jgi:3' terminal RNA ribose 2'-O-methyltransferase Hen1